MTLHVAGTGLNGGYVSAKFYRPGKAFASKSALASVACVNCGHVLTFLTDRGILRRGK
ncbi:hypothetical protein [Streptomyces sp. NBC_00083]|uniref:hypothetical protein n=1 Tax=Streptomyces sp. NBC_00083 TaxID=2975647 RepID=UPI00225179EA|nr:hypothetical protein [Streptomyces sp. NBC_00083]MCX5388204.1 hypothetical protein [Streptomyces sp. NBC_00083]